MTKEDGAKIPKAKKTKHAKVEDAGSDAVPYEVRMKAVTSISKPIASEKQVFFSTAVTRTVYKRVLFYRRSHSL